MVNRNTRVTPIAQPPPPPPGPSAARRAATRGDRPPGDRRWSAWPCWVRVNRSAFESLADLLGSRRATVGLIAGHWQSDSGAVCDDGLTEVEINLAVARAMAELCCASRASRRGAARVRLTPERLPRAALVAIHSDSCVALTGFKVARMTDSDDPEAEDRLVQRSMRAYRRGHRPDAAPNTITEDMRQYHALRQIVAGHARRHHRDRLHGRRPPPADPASKTAWPRHRQRDRGVSGPVADPDTRAIGERRKEHARQRQHYRTVTLEGATVRMINQPLIPYRFEIDRPAHPPRHGRGHPHHDRARRGGHRRGGRLWHGAGGAGGARTARVLPRMCSEGAETLRAHPPHRAGPVLCHRRGCCAAIEARESVGRGAAGRRGARPARWPTRTPPRARPSARIGAALIPDGARVLTHCNAGWLAFVDWGSALAPVYVRRAPGQARVRLCRRDPPALARARGSRPGSWRARASPTP